MKRVRGESEILLPGDMLSIGGASGPGEDVLKRKIVLRYLGKDESGNRQFVKTTIRTQGVSPIDVAEQIKLLQDSDFYDKFQVLKPELEQAQKNREPYVEAPHFDPKERLSQEVIEHALPERLMELTLQRAPTYKEQTVRDANLLAIVEHSLDAASVSLAVTEAVAEASPTTVERINALLTSTDIWAKIDQQLVLPLLMQVSRNRTFTPEQVYRFGSRAFMAHSDTMQPPVKEAMRIFVDKMKAEAGVDY